MVAGHSVGGQEAPRFSDKLWQAGIPVALVIGVDPGFAPPPPFHVGSPSVVDFWIPHSARGNPYKAAPGFQGTIRNVSIRDLGSTVDHVGIDKDPIVQIAYHRRSNGSGRPASRRPSRPMARKRP